MKDDTQETGRRSRYFQYAVFALAALLVVSLGAVLIPREPSPPAAPPFSEQARASAFADSLSLRVAGLDLAGAANATASAPQAAALARIVTLLTVQAQALMLPADVAGGPAPDGTARSSATAPANVPPSTTADLAAALLASGAQRLRDAETADGGIARLLAGAGTAQLLAAEDLASANGIALAPLPGAGSSSPASTAPTALVTAPAATRCASEAAVANAGTGADLGSALASAVEGELELIYAYQAALTRLNPGSAVPASGFLTQHGVLRGQAEALSRSRCAEVPLRQPGYALSQAFLADPAAALGTLEAGTLPLFGDLVALSEGPERAWALSALQSAARRTAYWGASPGPVPGVLLDEAVLPHLPDAAPAPVPSTTSARPTGNS